MPIAISADEVFEMACEMERNGAAFYRRAAEEAADESKRELLTGLAAMEDDHLTTFAAMRREFAGQGGIVQDENEATLYLRAMVDGKIFDRKADPTAIFESGAALAEILRIAIGLEKDSVVFYTGIKDAVVEAAGKQKIDAIIKQEMGHVLALTEELDRL